MVGRGVEWGGMGLKVGDGREGVVIGKWGYLQSVGIPQGRTVKSMRIAIVRGRRGLLIQHQD